MSGHSKWHNIQQKKGKTDKARSNLFTKFSKAITMAAQTGGGDSEMNFSLRLAIEKAKEGNVPKDNIERAIKRGLGELKDGSALEEIIYEGFGPGGVAFVVEAVTDNKNRTISEIKHTFNNYGGSLGGSGSVKWQFKQFGIVRISKDQYSIIKDRRDDFELALMDAGAEDIIFNEFGIEIRSSRDNFQKILEIVKSFGIESDDFGLEWIAKEEINVDKDIKEKVEILYEALDELDDVRGVYCNEE